MQIDLLIAGMRRAGTTMLANLLHSPPQQVSLIEPNLANPARLRKWSPEIESCKSLIVKEIDGSRITKTINQFDVNRTAIVVRDARTVAQSIHEWYIDEGRNDEPLHVALNRVVTNARFLVGLSKTLPNTPILRYEDFVQNPDSLLRQLGAWGLRTDGELGQRMRGREFESQRHGGRITARSLRRRENEPSEERIAIGESIGQNCSAYQSHFGYVDDTDGTDTWLSEVFASGWRGGGRETRCGAGSTFAATSEFRSRWPNLIQYYRIQTINDAGCGDLGWQSRMDLSGVNYRGFDVVRWKRWDDVGSELLHIAIANFVTNQLPPCDLTICRDAMIHLPNSMVESALKLFARSGPLLLATSFDDVDNSSRLVVPGGFAPIRLESEPFNLGDPILRINEPFENKYLGLWRLSNSENME